jgi:hypothetical protein
MVNCPSCNEPGIGRLRYQLAGALLPARCRICGAFASANSWAVGAQAVVLQFALFAALILALYWRWWALAAFAVIWVASDVLIIRYTDPVIRKAPDKRVVFAIRGALVLISVLLCVSFVSLARR